jgi:hypothetical protein
MPIKTNLASKLIGPTQPKSKPGSKKGEELLAITPAECFWICRDVLDSYRQWNQVESEYELKVLQSVHRFLVDAERGFWMKGVIGYNLKDNESDKWQVRLADFVSEALVTDGLAIKETLPGEYLKICQATCESIQLVIKLLPLNTCAEAESMGRATEIMNGLYVYAGFFHQSPGTLQDLCQSLKTSYGSFHG